MSSSPSISVNDLNVEFLPLIYDIIRSIEKDAHESGTQKCLNMRESHADCNQKMQILREKLNECREQINKLPGIGFTKDEQIKRLEALRQQLMLKRNLLMKYKHSPPFDINNK